MLNICLKLQYFAQSLGVTLMHVSIQCSNKFQFVWLHKQNIWEGLFANVHCTLLYFSFNLVIVATQMYFA